jgi:hypothetical protein
VAGTIIADVIQSDQSYPSSINIASPVIVSNTFAFPAGSNTAPAISPVGDTNTGIFFPAADTIAFAEGGAEAMRIDSSGRVGIGTTTPTSRFHVAGTSDPTITLQNTTGGESTLTFIAGGNSAIRTTAGLTFATAENERMRITDTGRVRINTTSVLLGSGEYLTVNGQTSIAAITGAPVLGVTSDGTGSQTYVQFYLGTGSTNTGNITTNGSTTTYGTSSDYRLKENIAPMVGALAKVKQLNPVTYTWKESGLSGEGFIAHELAEVCPDAVAGEKDAVDENGKIKPQSIDTSFLVATLTAAIQELKAELDTVKVELATLKGN